VEIELQYGSISNVANNIGMRSAVSYQYRVKVVSEAGKPLEFDVPTIRLSVDTSGSYL
jgi:hypothetical protein